MATDIWTTMEKLNRNGVWVEIGYDYAEDRDYELFSAFGYEYVGNKEPIIRYQRGLPEGVALDVTPDDTGYPRNEYKGKYLGDHSYNWFSIDELIQYEYWEEHHKELVEEFIRIRAEHGTAVRFIVGFAN